MLLEAFINLYIHAFARILSREDAKASLCTRYYIAISTPMSWKHIMTLFGGVRRVKGSRTPRRIASPSLSSPHCACDNGPMLLGIILITCITHFIPAGHRHSLVPDSMFGASAARLWGGSPGQWYCKTGRKTALPPLWESSNNGSLSRICTNTLCLFMEYSHV